jgi:hypothetical protein
MTLFPPLRALVFSDVAHHRSSLSRSPLPPVLRSPPVFPATPPPLSPSPPIVERSAPAGAFKPAPLPVPIAPHITVGLRLHVFRLLPMHDSAAPDESSISPFTNRVDPSSGTRGRIFWCRADTRRLPTTMTTKTENSLTDACARRPTRPIGRIASSRPSRRKALPTQDLDTRHKMLGLATIKVDDSSILPSSPIPTTSPADSHISVGALLMEERYPSFVGIQKADTSKSTELVYATDSRAR